MTKARKKSEWARDTKFEYNSLVQKEKGCNTMVLLSKILQIITRVVKYIQIECGIIKIFKSLDWQPLTRSLRHVWKLWFRTISWLWVASADNCDVTPLSQLFITSYLSVPLFNCAFGSTSNGQLLNRPQRHGSCPRMSHYHYIYSCRCCDNVAVFQFITITFTFLWPLETTQFGKYCSNSVSWEGIFNVTGTLTHDWLLTLLRPV